MAGKAVILLSIFCCYITILNISWAEKHIHLNIDPLLKNERIFSKLVDCILDESPCTGPIAKYKQQISSALETDCEECQEQFKQLAAKTLVYIRENKPDKFILIKEKFNITDEDFDRELENYEEI
ncbi:hypothetical protein PV327_003631 [Microctonus hyperodae]|uniref:Uncharacterized protein n=1 Tax=Microctonus hyperodae TaxID=165561 RepID=A0AA39G603_MICHY|nr:hypothetical protein PV327_003631 [Microctonus hyperodae]